MRSKAQLLVLLSLVIGSLQGLAVADEKVDRAVDQAALETQESSIAIIKETLSKGDQESTGPGRSVQLLERLLDLYRQNATILFRIEGGNLTSAPYTRALRNVIGTATRLTREYPGQYTAQRVLFLRGQAHEELKEKSLAISDYLRVADGFPETNEGSAATLSLADFAIAERHYTDALRFLHRIEARPSDPRYAIALYRLAWVAFNTADPSTAFSYTRKLARLYADKASAADVAIRENILLDSALFYLDAFERGLPGFTLSEALPKFASLDSNKVYGKMLLKLAQLLRSHGREHDLAELKNEVVDHEPNLPETLDVVLCSFEYGLNRRNFAAVREATKDFVGLAKVKTQKPHFLKVQGVLSAAFDSLQKSQDSPVVLITLAEISEAYGLISSFDDPKVRLLRFNLAEIQFAQKDFVRATAGYFWVYSHPVKGQENLAFDSGRRALASRYQELSKQGLIPTDLKPQALLAAKSPTMPASLEEWIRWSDEIITRYPRPLPEDLQHLQFECARAAYQQGANQDSLERLRIFASAFPGSRYAAAAASLALDTAQLANDWTLLESLSKGFLKLEGWNPPEFVAKLERAQGAALVMAGNAALGSGQKDKALQFFNRSLEGSVSPEHGASAHLGLALLHREAYQFLEAFNQFQAYFSGNPPNSINTAELRAMALQSAWLSGSPEAMAVALNSKALCAEAGMCADFRARQLMSESTAGSGMDRGAVKKEITFGMRSKSERMRLLWTVVALRFPEQFNFSDRLGFFREVPKRWAASEDLERLSILASLSRSVPEALTSLRIEISKIRSPLQRLKQLKDFEEAVVALAELPHAGIRSAIVHELTVIYAETIAWIKAKPPGDSLDSLVPILEKKAIAVSERAPKQTQELASTASPTSLLETLDPKESWSSAKGGVLAKWLQALELHNWPQAVFLMQEFERKKTLSTKKVSLMRMAALLSIGAT